MIVEVRGEVIYEKKCFNSLNEDRIAMNEEPFKNPRNAAGIIKTIGSLKLLEIDN